MANRTVKDAKSIRGTNPQYLVEKIIRTRIYDSKYWKEECFALSAELLVDKAMGLRFVGGVFGGNIRATPFICLTLKMLQIQPEKDIIVEFIRNEEFKYVRALGAFYMRLVGSSLDCYKYLEPLLADSRKLRIQKRDGAFDLIHMDEFIDSLLREERVCDVILPRIQKRHVLEENNELEAKVSALDDDFEEGLESSEEEEEKEVEKHYETSKSSSWHRRKSPVREEKSPIRDRSPVRNVHSDRRDREKKDRDRGRDRDRVRERDREREKDRDRRKHRERERHRRDRDRR
ncbi:pre-mRNA-splicing factor 38 [Planococcus citri]|uniref:pre-mRNA-splicing factor 38 n=1 Tax=Planococcus citri TaxID=170843 RepID=UPI0031FA18B5